MIAEEWSAVGAKSCWADSPGRQQRNGHGLVVIFIEMVLSPLNIPLSAGWTWFPKAPRVPAGEFVAFTLPVNILESLPQQASLHVTCPLSARFACDVRERAICIVPGPAGAPEVHLYWKLAKLPHRLGDAVLLKLVDAGLIDCASAVHSSSCFRSYIFCGW